ncbi:phage head-tail connector protein [Anaeromyxobacter sp. PSR-1]|uniref:phage head-tail connector protein n=1 Tax=Anaeromyxobacter sp. PSR-1 TaxID=1300915 RepID=UPI0005E2E6BE|nr:phage head-tail connector protein [Anaeromyxobacter sp. PSR-1]GAO01958.1 phage gp6-like head-tail connector protein [Anaeromyxobacter sp. PSR-1]
MPLATLTDLKNYLGITSTAEDALLSRLLSGSSDHFEALTGRTFASSGHTGSFDGDGSRLLFPGHTPIISVSSLTVDGEPIPERTSWSGDGYVVRPYYVELSAGHTFTRGLGNVVLAYGAGFVAVPNDVQQAVITLAGLAYKERTRLGVLSNTVQGEAFSYQTLTLPQSVQSVVEAYRSLR